MLNLMKSATALGLVVAMGFGATEALSKAHDQGVADGDREPGTSQAGGAEVGGQGGVSGNQKNGQRGDAASEAGSANSGDKGLGRK